MDKNHTTETQPAQYVWVCTYPAIDGDAEPGVSVHWTRAGAVAAYEEAVADYTDEPLDGEYHFQPEGQEQAWYSSWSYEQGYLIWTVSTREVYD